MHRSYRVESERAVDPQLISNIMSKIKSQGIFDKLRQSCLENVESNEHYQALKRRTDDYAKEYLNRKKWDPRWGKKEIRDSLRAEVLRQRFVSRGIESILEEIVNDDRIQQEFDPEVRRVAFDHLGIELPVEENDEGETPIGPEEGLEESHGGYTSGGMGQSDQIIVEEGAELQVNCSEQGDVIREESMEIDSDESASLTQELKTEAPEAVEDETGENTSMELVEVSVDSKRVLEDEGVFNEVKQEILEESCEVLENDEESLSLMQFVAEEDEDMTEKISDSSVVNPELDLKLSDHLTVDSASTDNFNIKIEEAEQYEDMLAEISKTNRSEDSPKKESGRVSRNFDLRSPGSESEGTHAGGRLKALKRRYEMTELSDEGATAKQPHMKSDESDSGASSSGSKPSSRILAGKLPLKKRCSALQTVEEENIAAKNNAESGSAVPSQDNVSGSPQPRPDPSASRPSSRSSSQQRVSSAGSSRSNVSSRPSQPNFSDSDDSDSSHDSKSFKRSSSKSSSGASVKQKTAHSSRRSGKPEKAHGKHKTRSPAKRRSKRSSQKHKNCPCCS